MLRQSRIAHVLWLLAIALIALRSGDVHLHFCADGQEAPVSVHVGDVSALEHASEVAAGHLGDRDLEISGTALVKKPSTDFDSLIACIFIAAVLLSAVRRQLATPRVPRGTAFHPFSLFLLRPPLRGPPA